MTSILPSIQRMQPGDHYCGIYRTDEDQRAIIIDFIRGGIERHEKMFYLVNLQSAEQLRATLAAAGIAVDALVDRGQLVILTAKEAYLKDGQFDPDKMIALLGEETEKALAEGYSALRATGEMTWALAGEPGSERLVEYESRLNHFFPDSKCYAVCQYDRRRFDAEMLLDILHTHPKVLFGREGYDNSQMYFVPPELFMERDRQSATLDTWLRNLTARGVGDA
ncbi:MAG: MEDS domain-containing protein [Deltaproteobacteria bacterium]|nr:MEDS domain-containing protein [Kofleriaceae bacterium]